MSVLRTVSSFLPPPRYLQLPSVGIDISDTSIKYLFLEPDAHSGRELRPRTWGSLPLEAGVLDRGMVHDREKLTAALAQVYAATKVPYVRLALPEERAYIFETEIERGTPFKEVRGMLEFRLEENVPLSPRDAHFDYHIVTPGAKDTKLTVVVTVYARETIIGYYEACRAAGVTPLSFEVEAQAIARSVLPTHTHGTHMIVDFGKTRSGIGIVHDGVLLYTSTIDVGGQTLSEALRKHLGGVSEDELTVVKNTQGLIRGAQNTAVYDALLETVSTIKNEIALRIDYWHGNNRPKSRFIEQVILCGGSANLKGLPGFLTDSLGVETVRADVWSNAFDINTYVPPIDQQHAYGYATAIGLALTSFTHHD